MIVKILEVWFLSSVPIGIVVGRLLERGSAPLADGTPAVGAISRGHRPVAQQPALPASNICASPTLAIAREH